MNRLLKLVVYVYVSDKKKHAFVSSNTYRG